MPTIENLWASPSTYTQGREGCAIEWIVVHYTATQASAYNNALYFSGGDRSSSAHYFLDGSGTIWHSVPDGDTAWAVGNWYMNLRSLSIEVVSDGRDFTDAEIEELRWLTLYLMDYYGIDADHVIRHYDVADYAQGGILDPYKHCPAPYVNRSKWNALHAIITKEEEVPTYPGRTVDVYDANDTAAQKWKLEKVGDFYRIRSTTGSRGKVLDVYDGKAVHTGSIQIFPANDTDAQLWTFEKCGGAWSGYYYIHPKKNSKVSIDVYNGDTTNLNRIWLYENNESAAQKWAVLPNEDGTVTFISGKGSHPAMDVYDGGRPF